MVRAGTSGGILDERRIALLDSIGMVWENTRELSWKQWYEALCRYKEQYGDIDVKSRYVDETGAALGAFLSNIRTARRDGRRNAFLTDEHIRQIRIEDLMPETAKKREEEISNGLEELHARYGLDFAGNLDRLFQGETLYKTIEYMRRKKGKE